MAQVKVAVIGCGFVFDKYMDTWSRHEKLRIVGVSDINKKRLDDVANYYALKAFPDNESLLKEDIDIVLNLTTINSHYEVTKAALLAGKHVYSEKPLTSNLEEARELFELASKKGLRLSCAPSNTLGSTCQTIWKIIKDELIGDVKLVYAEFDTSPLYLKNKNLKTKDGFPFLSESYNVTASGAPFPWKEEFEMGCTFEHVGYQLSWMCAMFGPVKSVTGFSKQIMPEKTDIHLEPSNTPDFSVGVLHFHSGVVGRVTCSISGVNDTSMKIIGNRGMVHSHTYGDYEGSVYLEAFNKMSIKWRYIRGLDTNYVSNILLGVGGRKVPLIKTRSKVALEKAKRSILSLSFKGLLGWFRRKYLGEQDKCIGLVELYQSIHENRKQFPPHDFSLHITEITLAIQESGENGAIRSIGTTFEPIDIPNEILSTSINYADYFKPRKITQIIETILDKF